MSAFAAGVIEDLKRRRLRPVAVLLLVAVVALPVFMLKSAPATPPPPAAVATPTSADGLPGPNEVLAGDRQLVSLAVLNESSNLESFEPKDPFKPLKELTAVDDGGASDGVPGTTGSAPTGGVTGGGDTSTGGSPTTGGGGGGGGGIQTPSTPAPAPTPAPDAAPAPRKTLTYALDMTIRGPKGLRSYTGLPKLSLLPSTGNPLLVFLGVEDAGTKAVFLVDAKLRSAPDQQEGTCTPSPDQCATLSLAPGEERTLVNDQGESWTLRIVEVREVSVARAAAAARKAEQRRARDARRARRAVGARKPAPRFVPPLITDLFTGGRS